jgi:uncharacterized protein YydD (DUF2326 family)
VIERVSSDLPGFKALDFKPGLNVLLADKSRGATDKQTRNRAGKSSFIDVVHLLLGAKCEPDSMFRKPALRAATFSMRFALGGKVVSVDRSGEHAGRVFLSGDFTTWPVHPKKGKDGRAFLSNDAWKTVLGEKMFGLQEGEGKWAPSFRSLVSYFARRERDGGMREPAKQNEKQQIVDQQVNLSLLLGVDWSVPQAWQAVRDRERQLDELRKSLKDSSSALGQILGRADDLRSELVVAHDKVERLRRRVGSFRVVEQFHELEAEATRLTQEIATLADDNALDRRYLAELEQATVDEAPPAADDLDAVYREAGVVLPGLVKRRFDAARLFHESIIKNRRAYLSAEKLATSRRVAEREQAARTKDARRAEVMGVLQSAGALDQFMRLQTELNRAEANVEILRRRYETADALERGDNQLKMERARLVERLRQEQAEQRGTIDRAILIFEEISAALYDDGGKLTVRSGDNGPEIDIRIHGGDSRGVSNMQVFCFDMMLMRLCAERRAGPGFLIHDSHLFDGVDERQAGKALALGAALARDHGFQYIVTMNTDAVPVTLPVGFSVYDHALPVKLTDATEDGGLFGFRFD